VHGTVAAVVGHLTVLTMLPAMEVLTPKVITLMKRLKVLAGNVKKYLKSYQN
jgi:hypothetical protein